MYEEENETTREFARPLTSKALRGKHTVEYLSVNGNTCSTVENLLASEPSPVKVIVIGVQEMKVPFDNVNSTQARLRT